MWIARDKNGKLWLHLQKPELVQICINLPNSQVYTSDCVYGDENYAKTKNRAIGFIWSDNGYPMVELSSELYPEVTFENSPKELVVK